VSGDDASENPLKYFHVVLVPKMVSALAVKTAIPVSKVIRSFFIYHNSAQEFLRGGTALLQPTTHSFKLEEVIAILLPGFC
jgi:hypothetical protein